MHGAMGSRLAHPLVRVGRGEDPRRPRDARSRQSARISGAVQTLPVLDCDRAQRRQRGGLLQHPLGEIRVEPQPLPFAGAQGAALVPDRVRDPEAAEVVDEAGTPKRPHVRVGQPQTGCGLGRERRDRLRVPEEVRRLQVDEVRDRDERVVEAVVQENDCELRLRLDHRVPRSYLVEAGQDDLGFGVDQIRDRRIEVLPTPVPDERPHALHAADAVRDLDELGHLGDPRRDRHLVARELAWPAAPVPALVRGAERVEHRRRESELLLEQASHRGVVLDHPVDLPVPGEHELQAEPEAVERGVPGPEEAEPGGGHAQAAQLVVVLDRLRCDVVAEPFRLFVRVGMAADVDEERGVVDDGALMRLEAEPFGHAEPDQTLAQHVIHRLPDAEVDPERERRDQLGQAHLAIGALHGHELTVTR